MADKKKNSDETNQTKSETTAAAHTIFNDPEQPQRPVTVETINKAVDSAVQKAFAKQEKKDIQKLKVRMKPNQVPVTKPQKIKGRFKTSTVPTNIVEETAPTETPESEKPSKLKVRMKSQKTIDPKPSKLKVRMKADAVPTQEESTPTGISINALADKLIEKIEEKAETEPKKPRVRIKPDAPYWNRVEDKPEEKPEDVKGNLIKAVLGKDIATKTDPTIKETPVAEKATPVAEPKIMAPTAIKVEPPVEEAPKKTYNKDEEHATAEAGLKALGFKKGEYKELLDEVSHIERAEDKILAVLKNINKPKSERVPVKPPIVEEPKATEITPEVDKADRLSMLDEPETPNHEKGTLTESDITKRAKKKPEATKAEPEDLNKTEQLDLFGNKGVEPNAAPVASVAPKLPSTTPVEDKEPDEDQRKAEEDKKAADEAKREAQREKEERARDKKIDDIYNKLSKKGLFELIADGIKGLLKAIIGPALLLLPEILTALAPLAAVAAVGVATYAGTKWLLNKFGYTGEGLSRAVGNLINGKEQTAAQVQASDIKRSENIKADLNNKLKGTGYTALGAGQFKNAKGEIVKTDDLPSDIKSKLGTTANSTEVKSVSKADIVSNPAPVSSISSAKIADATQSKSDNVVAPQVTVVQAPSPPAPRPQPPAPTNDGGALIFVRNDEPSASGLIASIFEHPVSYGAVYRM